MIEVLKRNDYDESVPCERSALDDWDNVGLEFIDESVTQLSRDDNDSNEEDEAGVEE